MTFKATPRQCAIDLGNGQCPRPCDGDHITCAYPSHRKREPELLALYGDHVDDQNDADDRALAEKQAIDEWRTRAGIHERTKEIMEELAHDREKRIAEKSARAAGISDTETPIP